MNPDPIIGNRLFVDGIVRPVFTADSGAQYFIDLDGHTRLYGVWQVPEQDEADALLVVLAASRGPLQ